MEWKLTEMAADEFYGEYTELSPVDAKPFDDRDINIFGGTPEQLEAMRRALSELEA